MESARALLSPWWHCWVFLLFFIIMPKHLDSGIFDKLFISLVEFADLGHICMKQEFDPLNMQQPKILACTGQSYHLPIT